MKEVMTPDEAAEFLGVSVHTLQLWRLNGGGPDYSQPDRTVWYLRKDILAWLEQHRRTSTNQRPYKAPVPKRAKVGRTLVMERVVLAPEVLAGIDE